VTSCFSEQEVRMFEKMPLSPAQYNARTWKAFPVLERALQGSWQSCRKSGFHKPLDGRTVRMSHWTMGEDRKHYVITACKDRIDPDDRTEIDGGRTAARTNTRQSRWLKDLSRISLPHLAKMQDGDH
jgi:hypothetical protein